MISEKHMATPSKSSALQQFKDRASVLPAPKLLLSVAFGLLRKRSRAGTCLSLAIYQVLPPLPAV